MIRKPIEYDPAELKNIWQMIRWRMNERQVGPHQLAEFAEYPIGRIQSGLKGEAAEITDTFLQHCAELFGLTSARNESSEKASATLTRQECIDLLKPPPAMPPLKANFWENDDDNCR